MLMKPVEKRASGNKEKSEINKTKTTSQTCCVPRLLRFAHVLKRFAQTAPRERNCAPCVSTSKRFLPSTQNTLHRVAMDIVVMEKWQFPPWQQFHQCVWERNKTTTSPKHTLVLNVDTFSLPNYEPSKCISLGISVLFLFKNSSTKKETRT